MGNCNTNTNTNSNNLDFLDFDRFFSNKNLTSTEIYQKHSQLVNNFKIKKQQCFLCKKNLKLKPENINSLPLNIDLKNKKFNVDFNCLECDVHLSIKIKDANYIEFYYKLKKWLLNMIFPNETIQFPYISYGNRTIQKTNLIYENKFFMNEQNLPFFIMMFKFCGITLIHNQNHQIITKWLMYPSAPLKFKNDLENAKEFDNPH